MRRAWVALAVLGLALAMAVVPAQAQGSFPVDPQAWAGGNGWCADGVCFRAWSTDGRIELRWVVDSGAAPNLAVLRRQITPQFEDATPIAESTCSEGACPGEFVYADDNVTQGALYQYSLVRESDGQLLGEPLEAGLAATAVDPGGSGRHRVYLPLALSQGR